MILAAADCATKTAPPPPELSDFFIGEMLGSLPYSGGWKDQPCKWIKRVTRYKSVYNAYTMQKQASSLKGKEYVKWARQNKNILDTINAVEEIRHGRNN